ncbi:Acetyltransferase (GNAT) family protein [Natronincola peptidivorans]|uniref:Acetyltransferase (GNAT) family protein n=1 Tax=Natronincola peptidivorans TaxID=426128 RepID=A0A1I0EBF8_9FIRM|nr:GNAT family N-acetyltransferase [Natronincola peptidivorans]SET42567.1 Acetyltransferase (GNAT) family protein [Natronincola peptidivorans]
MNNNVSIRRISQKERYKVNELIKKRAPKEYQEYLSEDEGQLGIVNSDYFFIYVAEVGSEPVGYIHIALIPKPDKRKGTMFIDDLWVEPEHRRKGIAEKLMEEAFKLTKKYDFVEFRLVVNTDNESAINLYRKKGFELSGGFFGRKPVTADC